MLPAERSSMKAYIFICTGLCVVRRVDVRTVNSRTHKYIVVPAFLYTSKYVIDCWLLGNEDWGHRTPPASTRLVQKAVDSCQLSWELDLSDGPKTKKRSRTNAWIEIRTYPRYCCTCSYIRGCRYRTRVESDTHRYDTKKLETKEKKIESHRTDDLCELFPLHDLDLSGHTSYRSIPDLYDLAHVFGWQRCNNLRHLAHVSWSQSVLTVTVL